MRRYLLCWIIEDCANALEPIRRNDKRILPLDPQQFTTGMTIIKSFALHNSAVTSGSGDGVGDTATGRRNLLGLR
jgi:hypothetical protein